MNVFKFELKQYFSSILIWGLAIPVSIVFYMSFFPIMANNAGDFTAIMDSFPEEVLAIFGMVPELAPTTFLGYYSITFSMIQIPIAIQAGNYGFNLLSVEERELTADFLLSKPIKRSTIIISKFTSAFIALLVTNIMVILGTLLSIALFADEAVAYDKIFVLLSTTVFFQLFFLSVGMIVSMLLKKIPSVLSFSMGLGFGTFILSSLGTMISSDWIAMLSPYTHFAAPYILIHNSYDLSMVWISFLVIIGSLVSSYFLYLRRNIPSL